LCIIYRILRGRSSELRSTRNFASGIYHNIELDPFINVKLQKISDLNDVTSMEILKADFGLESRTLVRDSLADYLMTTRKGVLYLIYSKDEIQKIFDFQTIPNFIRSFESGLLCIKHDPKDSYGTKYYVSYTVKLDKDDVIVEESESTPVALVVQEIYILPSIFVRNPSISLGKVIFRQNFPNNYHHGGTLETDPHGNLYLSLGDGGPQRDPFNYAQNLNSYRGKIIRFRDDREPEIVAYGLRNPWRFSIDQYDQMFIGDVGDVHIESLYLLPNLYSSIPYNCGWNYYEGSMKFNDEPYPFSKTLPPIFEYRNEMDSYSSSLDIPISRKREIGAKSQSDLDTPGKCIIGGFSLNKNMYVFGDFVSKMVYLLKNIKGTWTQIAKTKCDGSIFSFGKDSNGDIYVLGNGIYKIFIDNNTAI
jgi:hypothetical protein